MDEPKMIVERRVNDDAIKLLKLPDGTYQIRTYVGKNDATGKSAGTYTDCAEAKREFDASVRPFFRLPP